MGAVRDTRRRRGIGIPARVMALLAVAATALAGCSATPVPAVSHTAAPVAATPAPTPLDAAGRLLAAADAAAGRTDAAACAVSFVVADDAPTPQLQRQGVRFAPLPVPERAGFVFAGWYRSADAARTIAQSERVNGARIVQCVDRRLVLYGSWMTEARFRQIGARVPILMYHQFTPKPQGESGWLRANYIYSGALDQQFAYIAHGGFYLPTWDELGAFIDGRLMLPRRSVIITDDDAAPSWFSIGVPLVGKYHLLATSFVITKSHGWPSPSVWVQQRSHTNDMHRAGANGKGLMVNLPASAIAADLDVSARILGVKEVLAYPFGHYDATTLQGVRAAGFEMAVTTNWGYVTTGAAKLELPRVRMSYGMTVHDLAAAIG